MKTLSEKEKKLDTALNKLINVNLNTNLKNIYICLEQLLDSDAVEQPDSQSD